MPTYRPDVRPDFSLEAWSRTSEQIAAQAAKGPLPDGWLMNGQPTQDSLGAGEIRVSCPKCGSPHIAGFGASEPKYGAAAQVVIADPRLFLGVPRTVTLQSALPGFACSSADCGYTGYVGRV